MTADPFAEGIPEPQKSICEQLEKTVLDFEADTQVEETINFGIETFIRKIDDIDMKVIDIVGNQMTALSKEFDTMIKQTQQLFSSLTDLKATQNEILQVKTNETIALVSKLQATLNSMRKIRGRTLFKNSW